jgi:hypothetical protein
LVISVESEEDSLAVLGGAVRAGHLDEVWDCVIACVEFSSEIRFEVEESQVVDLDNYAGP